MKSHASFLCLLSLASAGCGGSAASIVASGIDGGGDATDSGSPKHTDAGSHDSGRGGVDSGDLRDARADTAFTKQDAEPDSEAGLGPELDASPAADGGEAEASVGVDASKESGSGERDAGVDAISDAGPTPSETLTVTTTGWGIVTASGGSLSCPSGCVAAYPKGTEVTVTATPSSGQTFTGWSGGPCSGTSTTCAFTIEATTTVHATFSATYPSTATTVDETYDCSLNVPLGGLDEAMTLGVTMQGAPPVEVPPGTTFNLPLFQAVATVPASVINTAVADDCTSVSGSVVVLDVAATAGASAQTVDAVTGAGTAYQFGPIALVKNTPVVLSLPAVPATLGTFTAGPIGPLVFTPGSEATSLSANLTFTCFGVDVQGALTCSTTEPAAPFATTSVQP